MLETEVAWAAGFFDGEGCITRTANGKGHRYLSVMVHQKDQRPLERFKAVVDVGTIYGPYESQHGMSFWSVTGKRAEAVLDQLWEHLSDPKREQAERVRESLRVL